MGRKVLVAAVAAVVVLGGLAFAGWWFWLRTDTPPPATLRDEQGEGGTIPEGVTPDGDWAVEAGDGVFVGYRIKEVFGGDTLKREVVGRSGAVEGSMTIDGTTVESVEVTADVGALESDQGRRDNYLRGDALETDEFPEASFVLTEDIDLGTVPQPGQVLETDVSGELTLHGVTNEVVVSVEARWDGERIQLAGSAPIVLADYDITAPDIAGLATVDEQGSWEFELTCTRAT
jgi:polyisoprenoid-binding protein YceI